MVVAVAVVHALVLFRLCILVSTVTRIRTIATATITTIFITIITT